MECCPDFRKVCTVGKFPNTASSSPQNSPPSSLPHQCLLSECLNVCWFAVSLFPLIHVLLSPSNNQDNLLQFKENCVAQVIAKQRILHFTKAEPGKIGKNSLGIVFYSLVHLYCMCLSLIQIKKSGESQFRVLQKEILTYSSSNLRSVGAVGFNLKPRCSSMDRIVSGSEPCPESAGKGGWMSYNSCFIYRQNCTM